MERFSSLLGAKGTTSVTEEEIDKVYIFTAKALYSLQEQINNMTKTNLALVRRIKALEEANLWNTMQGNTESVPTEPSPFIARAADGKVAFKCKERMEEKVEEIGD